MLIEHSNQRSEGVKVNALIRSCVQATRHSYNLDEVFTLDYSSQELEELIRLLVAKKLAKIQFINAGVVDDCECGKHPSGHRLTICYGGGIDSTVAAYWALEHGFTKEDILLVWVDYGQKYASKEYEAVVAMQEQGWVVKVIIFKDKLQTANEAWDYIVPCRNLFLAAIGAMYANEVWIVGTFRSPNADSVSDKSPEFYRRCSSIFSAYYNSPVRVDSPFTHFTRVQEITYLKEHHPEAIEVLRKTNTCYHPTKKFCGMCKSCYKRFIAMEVNDIHEDYEINPLETKAFWDLYIQKEYTYGMDRFKDVISALRKYVDRRVEWGLKG